MESFSVGFLLKKLIGTALMPIPVTLVLMLLAFWWLKRAPVRSRLCLVLAMLILGLSSWHPVADRLIRPLEDSYSLFDIQQPVKAVVVLGSASHIAPEGSPAIMNLGSSAVFRLEEGLRILRANPEATLIVSGYAGIGGGTPHAEILKQAAIELGTDPLRILAFPSAVDTEHEAELIAPLLQGIPFALVTEASHMGRAMEFFRRQGLEPIPAPATHTGGYGEDRRIDSRATYKTERAIYESLGRAWQWLKGII